MNKTSELLIGDHIPIHPESGDLNTMNWPAVFHAFHQFTVHVVHAAHPKGSAGNPRHSFFVRTDGSKQGDAEKYDNRNCFTAPHAIRLSRRAYCRNRTAIVRHL